MKRIFFLSLALLFSTSLWADSNKCVTLTVAAPNKTAMKENLEDYKAQGWKPVGKMLFKTYYGYFQKLEKGNCKKEGNKDVQK